MPNVLDFAKRYDFARIGSVMNYLTRETGTPEIEDFTVHAFDMLKLNAAGLITQGSDVMGQSVQAHAYSTYSQNASSSSRATKFSIKTPLTKGGLEHHTTTGNSQLDTANGMSLTISSAYRGYELRLLKASEALLYGCALPNFQEALTKLVSAQNVLTQPDSTEKARQEAHQAWQQAYRDFTGTYGHGFISGLKLISCAAGEIQMTYKSSGNQQQQRHGSSISGARKGVGASHASEWAKEHTQNQSDGTLSQKSAALPGESPCATWVSGCMTSWVDSGLDKIAAAAPPIPAPPATGVTAPDIPPLPADKQPSEKTLPPVTLTNPKDMVEYMQYEQMQADGVDITTTTWDQYQKQIADDTSKLDKDTVSQDGKQPKTPASAWQDSDQRGVIGEGAGMANAVIDVDFGGYATYDIEVTAYKDVFPSLKWDFHAAPSRAGLYLAKIHMFIMTRQLIGSYLTFLSSLPTVITGGSITNQEVGVFRDTLERYTKYVSTSTECAGINSDDGYRKAVDQFDQMLLPDPNTSPFKNGMAVYKCFVDNFRYLSNAPYGFLLTAKTNGKTFYPKWGTWTIDASGNNLIGGALTQWDLPVNTGKLVENSYRVFPIVRGGDKPGISLAFFVLQTQATDAEHDHCRWVNIQAGSLLRVGRKDETPDIWNFPPEQVGPEFGAKSEKTYPNRNNQLSVLIGGALPPWFGDNPASQYAELPVTLTPIDHKTVDYGSIHGIPMWYQLPFDLVKKSVLGGFGKSVEVED